MNTYIGIDIGGTNIRYGLVSAEGQVLDWRRFTVKDHRPEPVLDDLAGQLKNFLKANSKNTPPRGIGIGAPGKIDQDKGLVISSPNLPHWKNVPLGAFLQDAFELPVRLDNDANLYALGEWLAGAGQGLNNLLVITLGTGVGGGLILGGRLWAGSFGPSCEIGHMIIEPNGRPCNCGRRGCLETLASATAMTGLARELITQGYKSGYRGRLEALTTADLFHLAEAGDELALLVFDRAGAALGVAVANVVTLLGLEGVVIGGGAGAAFRFLRSKIFKALTSGIFGVNPDRFRLAQSVLGDMAPLIGAPRLFAE